MPVLSDSGLLHDKHVCARLRYPYSSCYVTLFSGGVGESSRFAPATASSRSSIGGLGSSSSQKQVEAGLRSAMLAILQAVNQRHSHIPPVLTAGPLSFPFDVSISRCVAQGDTALIGCGLNFGVDADD